MHRKKAGWKSRKNYAGTTESALWRNAGSSAYKRESLFST